MRAGDPDTLRAIIALLYVALCVACIVIAVLADALRQQKRALRAAMAPPSGLLPTRDPARFGDLPNLPPGLPRPRLERRA